MSTEVKTVNLQQIASQLEQSAKTVEAKVKGTEERYNIPTSAIAKKVPELKNFGKSTIFQARWDKENECMRVDVPKVCKSYDTEKVITQLPDLEELSEVEYIKYVTGLGGYAVIKIENTNFQIGLTANLDLDDDELEKFEGIDGTGEPPIEVLGYEKRPEIHLKTIPENEELIVVANGKKSCKHETSMCDVKISSTGEIVKNVLCNTQLERLIVQYGSEGGCKFKITKKTKLKDGKTKVSILDLNGVDFSDLEL